MLSSKDRENIALKRFSLISPVLNSQVDSQKLYFEKICSEPIQMPYYGLRVYSPKTLASWLNDYRKSGIDGLKPGFRADRGKSRKVSPELADLIREKRVQMPRISSIMLYEELVRQGVILPEKLSQATFYRFLAANKDLASGKDGQSSSEKDLKRFSHQFVNELWQTDIMFGPYIKMGKSKKQTFLLTFLDDASRLVCAAQFWDTQNFAALRATLKDAILKRGIPKLLYTDNGKVYRNGQLALICASLGCSLIHTEPFTPNSKGKIERFFQTVRQRFLTKIDPTSIKSVEELNLRFWQWLEEDYQRKIHSAIGMSPLDFFMAQANHVKLFSNPQGLDELFLLRVARKVNHDATLSVETVLFETSPNLANSKVEVRYEPEWLTNPNKPIYLYRDGHKVGEARQVNFHDNAHVKRKGPGRPVQSAIINDTVPKPVAIPKAAAISFANLMEEKKPKEGQS